MSWLAVCDNGDEYIFKNKQLHLWLELDKGIKLPKGSIEKLIGKKLNWRDEPVEFNDIEEHKICRDNI